MKRRRSRFWNPIALGLTLGLLLGLQFASAQTMTLAGGVQKLASLSGTTVNLSGKCELWVTNSSAPLSGCVINLDSPDAWLFLPAVKPSVVASAYLGQVRVSGGAAVADNNVRVVQYGQAGAIVIPQSASFQPLTVFSQPQFGGASTSYGQWTYYTGGGIANFGSFRLKRGYQAVFAQDPAGAKYSQCYIAQDGDLEIGVLPPALDRQVQFIYVTPWRWTPKKGIAGDPGLSLLNLAWWYNWNISSSSSRDLEYVAIRQNRWWPGLGQNWPALGINTVLGYNEPDSSSQANIAVGDALWSWPDLLATGLRVGSPATTDGGRSDWLYPFVSQADAAGLRVDFVAIHYYQSHNPADAAGAASQMYSFLLDIWNNTHRPIWVTEWNNGANWTDSQWPAPTYAQQQACVQAMVNMLESTPFVERYALYNWVEDTRAVTTNGVLTPAGVVYRDQVSSLSYSQAMPDNGTRGLAEFLFATNAWDTVGYYNNGMTVGAPGYATGHVSQAQAIVLDGANSYVQLPANIARGSGFTFAAWVYWNGGGNWQRLFDFGNDTSHYLFLTPNSGSSTLRFAINNGSGEQIVQRAGVLASGSWQHVALTLGGSNATLYVNGAPVASSNSFSIVPSAFKPMKNYLGKSQFPSDPLFNGALDGVEIADYALTAAQVSALYNNALNPTWLSGVWTNDASDVWGSSNNWSRGWIANGVSRMADFSTLNLTADRTVTLDSPRTIGGLRFGDAAGAQNWILSGPGVLTLDGGSNNAPLIAVNQNTATVAAPLAGANGLAKSGNGTLALTGTNTLGGGLVVNAGAVKITAGSTVFGNGTSTVGYLTGTGNLTLAGGNLNLGGELRVGGSDQSGTQYTAAGTATLTAATLGVGSLTVARGNYLDNSVSGTVTLNGGSTLISTNDVVLEFAGKGLGKLALNGGNLVIGPAATKWFMIGYWDSGAGELDITNGNVLLENNSSIKFSRGNNNTGSNVVNQLGGTVTFYSDAGLTVGGGGSLDLSYAGGTNSHSAYNLRGGTLSVPQIIATSTSGARTFNFNGGVLRAAGNNAGFMAAGAASTANVRNPGAIIDTTNFNITISQALVHSTIAGDAPIDGGLSKRGAGTLTLAGVNTYTGPTAITGGTLALAGSGSVANSSAITLSAGTTFDVSGAGYTLGAAQSLKGTGVVNGPATINGTLSPGLPLGALTFSTAPVLNGTTLLQLDRASSPGSSQLILKIGTLNYGGVLTVVNVGPALQGGDTFQLFQAAGIAGSFSALNLPALDANLAWNTNALGSGWLSVVSTGPASLALAVSGGSLNFSWPPDHTGWRLQVQTNRLDVGLSTNWVDVPGSVLTNTATAPADAVTPSVFYRLVYP